jgi:magnesium-transporting ATPase (P-type)
VDQFSGTVTVNSASGHKDDAMPHPIEAKNILLRGCVLRNTEYVYALVLNTGYDCKIMQSSTSCPSKVSSMNQTLNKLIMFMCVLLGVFCAVSATCEVWWSSGMHF